MPPAPSAPGPAQQARAGGVAAAAGGAASAAKALPAAEATTAAARGAVTEPAAETAARARADLAAELGERPPPSPEIVALCERIRTSIREKRPINEDELLKAKPEEAAKEAGAGLTTAVGDEAKKVEGGYDAMNQPPAGTPQLQPTPVTPPPTTVADPGINATAAKPDPIPAQNLSLDADKAAVDQKVADARVERPSTADIKEAPFSTIRDGQAGLGEMAKVSPAELAAKQAEALATAETGMADLQGKALAALRASRAGTVTTVSGGQTEMVGTEEQQRAKISKDAQTIFDEAKASVTGLLEPLGSTAINRWDAGVATLSTDFRTKLDTVQKWIDERHAGVGGAIVGAWDALAGLPSWVTTEYDKAEHAFGEGVCTLLTEISRDVNAVVAAAQGVIDSARSRIDKLFADLPAGLKEWALGEQAKFSGQLDGLAQQVTDARTSFVKDISAKAVSAVAEVQGEVEKLRAAAKGLVGEIIDALNAFLADPVKGIINALLTIVGIPPASFWALIDKVAQVATEIAEDPVKFLNNLVAALQLGFNQFFDNFGKHVLGGFWKWIFSGLKSGGIAMPADFGLKSLLNLVLQIMGITWPRIRVVLAKHIGEKNVVLIEHAWKLVSTLIEKGPQGIVDMLKDALDPAKIIEQVVSAAVDFIVEALIKQVALRIIGLLNPAGAVFQAMELIYKVLKWVFENAAKIFSLVEAVVNGMADVMAGKIGGAANLVEKALAATIPIVIDFLAGFLGLGDLPEQVAKTIEKLQAYVMSIVEKVIVFLVVQAKALMKALGLGGDDKKDKKGKEDEELGTTVRFSADGESHKQWVETKGDAATPMIASNPVSVSKRLGDWRTEVPKKFDKSPNRKQSALDLLQAGDDALKAVDKEADDMAKAYSAHKEGEPLPSDDGVESNQKALSSVLKSLFVLFEEGDLKKITEDIAKFLPVRARARADMFRDEVWERVKDIRIGNKEEDPKLYARRPDLGRSAALSYVATAGVREEILPYFLVGDRARSADTDAFAHYVFIDTSATHTVRRRFHEKLGDGAQTALRTVGAASLAAATNVPSGPKYKDKLAAKVAEVAYSWSPDGGSWVLPTENIPDHWRYEPEDAVIPVVGGKAKYKTKHGQSFDITVDPATMLTTQVVGANLQMLNGRGVTDRSPGFAANQGFNSAHLVANEFGGSGFDRGLNLATTSEQFNKKTMRGVELQIGRAVKKFANDNTLNLDQVKFSLTVDVTYGALQDVAMLNQIRTELKLPATAAELDAVIAAKITTSPELAKLTRVETVTYLLEITAPAAPGRVLPTLPFGPIGPDLWILL